MSPVTRGGGLFPPSSGSVPDESVALPGRTPVVRTPTRFLPVSSIRKDGETQHRAAVNADTVAEYAELMREGVEFPPITVWWDGESYWLSDGFQRLAAAELAGFAEIAAQVCWGTLLDAQWDSFAANATHGVRRTPAEVQAIVQRAINHPNAAALSTAQLAKHLHLPETTVRRWRKKLSSPCGEDRIRVVIRGNSTYAVDTANIGQRSRQRKPRSRRDIRAEIADMTKIGSPEARRVLTIVGHWVSGEATPEKCVAAIEIVLAGCLRQANGQLAEPGPRARQSEAVGYEV
jgi:hypothetical protein